MTRRQMVVGRRGAGLIARTGMIVILSLLALASGAQETPVFDGLTLGTVKAPSGAATGPVLQAAAAVICPGVKPTAGPCEVVTCYAGEWVSGFKAVGTACNDSNACTYSDVCDSAGGCRGAPVSCVARGPCETSTCNGTATCIVATRPAGAACPYSNTGNPADPPNPCENACDGSSYRCQP